MDGKKRVKTIELQVGDKKQSFEIGHDERILKMQNNGGWKLPTDSKYIFGKDGITTKPSKKSGSKSE